MISRPEDPCFSIPEDAEDPNRELTVTFHPPLYQQRRIWILDMLRAEKNLNSVRYRVWILFYRLSGANTEVITGTRCWLWRRSTTGCAMPAFTLARAAPRIGAPSGRYNSTSHRFTDKPDFHHYG